MCQCPPSPRVPSRQPSSGRRSWLSPGMPLVARGSTSVDHVEPTGGCRVCATSSGAHRIGSPPAQGSTQILGTGDVSATMPDKLQQSSPNSGWCLSSVHRQSCGYCRYATETGTHSVKLCIFGLVIDMPVVVHVKVVDNPVMVQRPFLLVQFSRPLRFPSCSPLIRCSMSLLRRFRSFLGCRS